MTENKHPAAPLPPFAPVTDRWRNGLELLSTLITAIAAVAVTAWVVSQWLSHRPSTFSVPSTPVSLDDAVLKGEENARFVILEYSDFECPFCGAFARASMPAIERDYVATGIARVGFVHMPLEALHPNAFRAAEAAVCAGRQKQFWQMHDLLFADQQHLAETDLVARAETLKLDLPSFKRCLGGEAASVVRVDLANATALNLRGTPTFLIGTAEPGGTMKVQRIAIGTTALDQIRSELGARRTWWKAPSLIAVGIAVLAAVGLWIERRGGARRGSRVE